ncbi:hypothetical protein BH23CHL6_BH23CHL6_13290 [soil metagenome]
MHLLTGPRVASSLLLAITLVLTGQLGAPAEAGPRQQPKIKIEHFMAGLACVESGGRYKAVNPHSGALGKYQIMPRNWTAWARRFLGDRRAEPTPRNQEIVARERIERLYADRGSWRRVAYWWLTGRSISNEARWTRKASGYVDRVMTFARRAATPESDGWIPQRCFPKAAGQLVSTAAAAAVVDDRPAVTNRVVVTGGSVYVRRGPGPENRLVAVVRRGTVLKVTDRSRDSRGGTWLEVKLRGGDRGWVAGWYTEPR